MLTSRNCEDMFLIGQDVRWILDPYATMTIVEKQDLHYKCESKSYDGILNFVESELRKI